MKGNDKWRESVREQKCLSTWECVSEGAKGRDLQEQNHQMNCVKQSPHTQMCLGHNLKHCYIFLKSSKYHVDISKLLTFFPLNSHLAQ